MDDHPHALSSPFQALKFAVITASDTRSFTTDRSGEMIVELVAQAGHQIVRRELLPDDLETLRQVAEEILKSGTCDVLVVTGGTGPAPRDVTPEAIAPLFERELEGFGELFRIRSWETVGPMAMLSRARAGTVGCQAVFLLPGSPRAVELALRELILPVAPHLVSLLSSSKSLAGALAPAPEPSQKQKKNGP
jgi:molybdenum cofactor biosynthesis protein B